MEKTVELDVIQTILRRYGFREAVKAQKMYLHGIEADGRMKLIFGVTLADGKKLVLKLLHEDEDLAAEFRKIEKQSIFSEIMRSHGIRTPVRHQADGNYCTAFSYQGLPCLVTVEDWCGEEITEITTEIACRIGELMARMHRISLEHSCEIGHRTLFSAAYWNDVDSFPEFCEIVKNEKLDQDAAARIKALREEKLERIRAIWETLPKAAVQGDISINNLVDNEKGLIVFDYNNAGDEVLVSDLVMEGLLTAYEMDLPEGVPASHREALFPAFLKGYLSVRPLSEAERKTAWEIYTLYHGLWFTRIVYNEDSLDSLVKKGDYDAANQLLKQMLADMEEEDDGRFGGLERGEETKILPITDEQYDVFHRLLTDYYRDGEDAQTPQEELDGFIGALFALCQENRISGCIAYEETAVGFVLWGQDTAGFPFSNKPGYGTILEIGVIPAMRGTGLGRRLAAYAENAMACETYYVCAYGPAETFWKKCGYRYLGETGQNGLKLLEKDRESENT